MYIGQGALIALIGMSVVFLFLTVLSLVMSLLMAGGRLSERRKDAQAEKKRLEEPGSLGLPGAEEDALREAMAKFLEERYNRTVDFEIKEIKEVES